MLLYVYTLDENDAVNLKSVEVKETKLNFIVKERLDHICFYQTRLPKDQLAEVQYDAHLGYSVVLVDRDDNLAKTLITSKINEQKKRLKKKIDLLEQKKVNIILGFALIDVVPGGTN